MYSKADMTPILEVRDLVRTFSIRSATPHDSRRGELRAVDGVSFALPAGETLGIVGESGSGKTVLAMLLLRLIEPTSGEVLFDGERIDQLSGRDLRAVRRRLQPVFQNPGSSFNPRTTIGDAIAAPLSVYEIGTGAQRRERVSELLQLVGLKPDHARRFPHQFSGGQLQRLAIARGLALEPDVLVLDEPVSGLDVSIQAQILNLLSDLQDQLGVSYVFIAHNLNVISHISDRVAVMHRGRLVEVLPAQAMNSEQPNHPYTETLLDSILPLTPGATRNRGTEVSVQVDPVRAVPQSGSGGCDYADLCALAQPMCRELAPVLKEVAPGHLMACHVRAGDGVREMDSDSYR